jgi:membrane protein DedA with SNARE-associated domain
MAKRVGRVSTVLDPLLAASAPPQHLPGVLHSLEPTLNRFGYLALALIFLEDFGVPVPGETVLIIAAVYAGTGRFNVWLVALIGFLAAILGDNVGFAIGHFGGRPLAERFGKYIFLTPERLDKTANFFDRHGGKVIVIARFVEGLRQANGIIAGITGMHWTKFVPFNALGAALWVGIWVSIGYFSGSNIDSIYHTATKYEAVFGAVVGVLIVAWIARRVWKHQKGRAAKIAASSESAMAERDESESPTADAGVTGPTRPEATEHTEPATSATESTTTEPSATEPAATERTAPTTTEPSATEPTTTEPTDPTTTEPSATEPTEPAPTPSEPDGPAPNLATPPTPETPAAPPRSPPGPPRDQPSP